MKMYALTSLFLIGTLGVSMSLRAQAPEDSAAYYYRVITKPYATDETDKAIGYFQKNRDAALHKKDTMAALYAQRLLVIGQYEMGFLYESEETAIAALQMLEQQKESETTTDYKKAFYIHLGRVYRSLQNAKASLYYYDQVLALAVSKKDSIIQLNNKANVHADIAAYDLAQTELELAYQKALQQEETLTLAKVQDNLGFVQSKLGLPMGLTNMQEALALRLRENDLTAIYSSYRHLTEYYLDQQAYPEAEALAQKAYQTATSLHSASYLENAIHNLIKSKNDPDFNHYLFLTDSLSKAKLAQENKYAGIKFNFEKEARRANANELEKEKAKRKTLLYQGIGGLVLVSGIFLYFLLRNKHRKEKLQEIYRTETRISKKVHDEVANDVYHVMTKLQNTASQDEALLDDLEQIYTKTRDISKESGAIEVQEHFDDLLTDLLLSYQSTEVSIITRNIGKIDWDALPDTKKTTLYRVLQELMTNMRKHSQATLVAIVFGMKGRKLQIEYTDNGVGTDLQKKSGLRNTENRMETINGHISFDSAPNTGFKATIIV